MKTPLILVACLLPAISIGQGQSIGGNNGTSNIVGRGRGSSTCLQGSVYPDGCPGAQGAGSSEIPDFFTGFTGTSYRRRPPWNVAGVDYPVGYAGPLSDPSGGNLPGCASYSVNLVTIDSAPCTINGFDFGLHGGIGLSVSSSIRSGTIAITNNNFAYGSAFDPDGGAAIQSGSGIYTLVIKYNSFDGIFSFSDRCSGGCPSAFIRDVRTSGDATVEYNAFINSNEQDLLSNSFGTLTLEFNYVSRIGLSPSHGEINNNTYSGNGTQTINADFNTCYSGPSGAQSNATACIYITNSSSGSPTLIGSVNNNTLVAVGTQGNISRLIEVDPGGTVGALAVNENYFDGTGAYGYWALISSGLLSVVVTCIGNYDMVTGDRQTGTVSSYGAGWTCS